MNSYRRIASVRTSNTILVFLSEQEGLVSGIEIAKALDLPHGTVMCHLCTHEDSHFVNRIGDKYELGPCLASIWAAYRSKLEAKIGKMQEELRRLEV